MPCDECEESAKENGSAGYVMGYREVDGVSRYTCFKCVMKLLKESNED